MLDRIEADASEPPRRVVAKKIHKTPCAASWKVIVMITGMTQIVARYMAFEPFTPLTLLSRTMANAHHLIMTASL